MLCVAFLAFVYFVYDPPRHAWNVYRMDVRNDLIWEHDLARVATLAVDVETDGDVERLTTEIICYDGYWARPWSIKTGPPATGRGGRSAGPELLQADLPSGEILVVDVHYLCRAVLHETPVDLPLEPSSPEVYLIWPEIGRYCAYPFERTVALGAARQTPVGLIGYPRVVATEERPLRDLVRQDDLSSYVEPLARPFFQIRQSTWRGASGTLCASGPSEGNTGL